MRRSETHLCFACPVDATLHAIGGKWKPSMLFHLLENGTLRFNQFRRVMPAMTLQALTNALRELEADGIVHREVYAQVPPKVEDAVTEMGYTLRHIRRAMCDWGAAHGPRLAASPAEAAR